MVLLQVLQHDVPTIGRRSDPLLNTSTKNGLTSCRRVRYGSITLLMTCSRNCSTALQQGDSLLLVVLGCSQSDSQFVF